MEVYIIITGMRESICSCGKDPKNVVITNIRAIT